VGPEDDEDLAEKLQKEMGCLGGINYGAGRWTWIFKRFLLINIRIKL
jgi:hypothetical protein